MINKRHIEIIHYIFKENIYDVKYLSDKLNISERMLRYDINEIIYYFGNIIEIKSNKILLNSKFEELNDKINNFNLKNYSFSLIEQENLIILDILLFKNKFKIYDFESNYGVSRSTIQKIIKSINHKFSKENIKIISYSNKGYKLIFNEFNLRKIFINTIINLKSLNSKNYLFIKIINEKLDEFSKNINISSLEKKLIKFFENQKIKISDNIFKIFLYFIFISYNRNKENIIQDFEINNRIFFINSKEFSEIKKFFFNEFFLENDCIILCDFYIGLYNSSDIFFNNWIKLDNFINMLLKNLSDNFKLNFKNDLILKNELISHIKPTIVNVNIKMKCF